MTTDFVSELYINEVLTDNDWNVLTRYGDVNVFNDSGPYTFSFENDVVVKITVNFEFKLMTFSIIMSPDLSGNVTGLFGEFCLLRRSISDEGNNLFEYVCHILVFLERV